MLTNCIDYYEGNKQVAEVEVCRATHTSESAGTMAGLLVEVTVKLRSEVRDAANHG